MSKKGWFITNVVVTVVGAMCGLAGIFTGIKAEPYNEELKAKEIEKKD